MCKSVLLLQSTSVAIAIATVFSSIIIAMYNKEGYVKCIGKCILSFASQKSLEYEECEQLDSGGGGALSQGAGHDGSFFDSIILGIFICCLAQEKR